MSFKGQPNALERYSIRMLAFSEFRLSMRWWSIKAKSHWRVVLDKHEQHDPCLIVRKRGMPFETRMEEVRIALQKADITTIFSPCNKW